MTINTKQKVTWLIKSIAAIFGLLGTLMIIMFSWFAFDQFIQDKPETLAFYIFGAILGLVYTWVAYGVLTKYTLNSIRSLSALIVLMLFGQLIQSTMPYLQELMDSEQTGLFFLLTITPLLIMIIAYKILVSTIIKYSINEQSN